MIVNLTALLADARRGKYAIGSFNVYSYETIRGVVEAGQELACPMIVAFGENYLPNMDFDEVAAIVKAMSAKVDIPLVLHLDHCKSFDNITRAIEAGFTSVMYDGSHLPFADNLRNTAEIVALAHSANVSVEAELGALAGGMFSNEEAAEEIYTDPHQAADFIAATKVDALAVSIGTVHGMYKGTPRINLQVLRQIAAKVTIPLVLHGGSGTPEEIIKECIRSGIAKINVNTEISTYTMEELKGLLAAGPPCHLSMLALKELEYVKKIVLKYAVMFNKA